MDRENMGFEFVVTAGREKILTQQMGNRSQMVQLETGVRQEQAGVVTDISFKDEFENVTSETSFAILKTTIRSISSLIEMNLDVSGFGHESVITVSSVRGLRMYEIIPTHVDGKDTFTADVRYFSGEECIQTIPIKENNYNVVVLQGILFPLMPSFGFTVDDIQAAEAYSQMIRIRIIHPVFGEINMDDIDEEQDKMHLILEKAQERRTSQS